MTAVFPALDLRLRRGRMRIRLPEPDAVPRPHPWRVLIVSSRSAARSQMAAAFFNDLADPVRARAISAGEAPAGAVDPAVVRAMAEVGIALPPAVPRRLTASLAMSAGELVVMGRLDEWPFFAPARIHDWPLPDPRDKSAATVRRIRDEIRRRVVALIETKAWGRNGGGKP